MYPYKSTKEDNEKRKEHDYYSTPDTTTEALLDYLAPVMNPKLDVILEPACGEGKMAEVFRKRGFKVDASDKYPYEYEKAVDKYKQFKTRDFLELEATSASWIITNPPFNLAEEFIVKAASLWNKDTSKGFAMLLKSTYWHAKSRYPLFQGNPPAVILPLTWRPKFNESKKAPVLDMMWCVWMPKDVYESKYTSDTAVTLLTRPEED